MVRVSRGSKAFHFAQYPSFRKGFQAVAQGALILSALALLQGCGALSEEQKREFFALQKSLQDTTRGLEVGAFGQSFTTQASDDQVQISNRAREIVGGGSSGVAGDSATRKCSVTAAARAHYSILGEECPLVMRRKVDRDQGSWTTQIASVDTGFLIRDDQLALISDIQKMDVGIQVVISRPEDFQYQSIAKLRIEGTGKIVSKARGEIPLKVEGERNESEYRFQMIYTFPKFTANLEILVRAPQESNRNRSGAAGYSNVGYANPLYRPTLEVEIRLNGEVLSTQKIRQYLNGDDLDTTLASIVHNVDQVNISDI